LLRFVSRWFKAWFLESQYWLTNVESHKAI
jgi:hypothetical protein